MSGNDFKESRPTHERAPINVSSFHQANECSFAGKRIAVKSIRLLRPERGYNMKLHRKFFHDVESEFNQNADVVSGRHEPWFRDYYDTHYRFPEFCEVVENRFRAIRGEQLLFDLDNVVSHTILNPNNPGRAVYIINPKMAYLMNELSRRNSVGIFSAARHGYLRQAKQQVPDCLGDIPMFSLKDMEEILCIYGNYLDRRAEDLVDLVTDLQKFWKSITLDVVTYGVRLCGFLYKMYCDGRNLSYKDFVEHYQFDGNKLPFLLIPRNTGFFIDDSSKNISTARRHSQNSSRVITSYGDADVLVRDMSACLGISE